MQVEVLKRLTEALDAGQPARSVTFEASLEIQYVQSLNLLTTKPVLYVCNIADPDEADNVYVQDVRRHAEQENAGVVVLVGKIENEIMEIEDPEERQAFLEELGLNETGLDRMIHEGYRILDLCTYFTVGEKENRAWTIPKNSRAPQAAGVIHSDFEKGFIRAEAYNFDDLVKYGSESAVKEAGQLRVEGKDYVVQDGDILHFRFNV